MNAIAQGEHPERMESELKKAFPDLIDEDAYALEGKWW